MKAVQISKAGGSPEIVEQEVANPKPDSLLSREFSATHNCYDTAA